MAQQQAGNKPITLADLLAMEEFSATAPRTTAVYANKAALVEDGTPFSFASIKHEKSTSKFDRGSEKLIVAFTLKFADGHEERMELSATKQRLAMVQAAAAFVAVTQREQVRLIQEGPRAVYGFAAAK